MQDKQNQGLEWKLGETKHVVQDPWIDFRSSEYLFPDGRQIGPFYTFSKRDYVVVVASDEEGRFLCVKQYRHGINAVTTEFPAGGMEYGKYEYTQRRSLMKPIETPFEAAKRELLEETGYESDNWKHILDVPSNATDSDNFAHIFLATKCRKTSDQHLDDTEFLNIESHSALEIEDMIRNGSFQQAMHIMAWYMVKDLER